MELEQRSILICMSRIISLFHSDIYIAHSRVYMCFNEALLEWRFCIVAMPEMCPSTSLSLIYAWECARLKTPLSTLKGWSWIKSHDNQDAVPPLWMYPVPALQVQLYLSFCCNEYHSSACSSTCSQHVWSAWSACCEAAGMWEAIPYD